jgi:hypothetical protein
MTIASDVTSSDDARYPSRVYDAEAKRRYIVQLVERLATLERETHPAGGEQTAVAKDARAAEALRLAGRLVKQVAGWALHHQIGLAQQGLGFVRFQYETKDRPEYLEYRSHVDSHEHELVGGNKQKRDLEKLCADDPPFARALLTNLLLANPGGFPIGLQHTIIEALKGLDYGDDHPIFTPEKASLKRGYKALRCQLQAIAFVEYRVARGKRKHEAQGEVSRAFGVDSETLRKWEKRLPEKLGEIEVARAIFSAKTMGSLDAAADRERLAVSESSAVDYQLPWAESFSPAALIKLVERYNSALREQQTPKGR